MFCSLENAKSFKETPEELITLVKENLPKECDTRGMEDFDVELNGRWYVLCEVEEDDIISEGKWESGGTTYQLVEFDKAIESYPCGKSITNEYDLLVYVGFGRSGSYFSDWYYEYDKPELKRIEIEVVPEQVIPEHEEISIKSL